MEPVGQLGLVLLKTLGMMVGALAVLVVVTVVFLDIWAKRHVAGMIYCVFLEQRSLFSKLLKIESEKVYLGKGDNKEEYLLDTNKQFWTWWPPGLPRMVQVPVRTHWYLRNTPEPIDPENVTASISSRSLRLISDEAMLKATWKDVRESVGAAAPVRQGSNLALILVFATLAVSGFTLYLVMGIKHMLGG
jgi:hypothetical protein